MGALGKRLPGVSEAQECRGGGPHHPAPFLSAPPRERQVTGLGWRHLPNTLRRFLRRMQARYSLPSVLSCQSGTITEPGAGDLAMGGHPAWVRRWRSAESRGWERGTVLSWARGRGPS